MFSHLRLTSRCLRPCPPQFRLVSVRNFSSTIPARISDTSPIPPTEEEVAAEEVAAATPVRASVDEEASEHPESYNDFMDRIGFQFQLADKPRNWLGGQVVEFVFTSS